MSKLPHVALEGIDGSGKSTQFNIAIERLEELDIRTARFQYSGKGNVWGSTINALNERAVLEPVLRSEIVREALYAMSARSNYQKTLQRSDGNELILADRSIVSAYASHNGRLPNWFITFCEPVAAPELVIYYEIDPEHAVRRLESRGQTTFDESLSELEAFALGYEAVLSEPPPSLADTRFVRIDASKPVTEVSEATIRTVLQYAEEYA